MQPDVQRVGSIGDQIFADHCGHLSYLVRVDVVGNFANQGCQKFSLNGV